MKRTSAQDYRSGKRVKARPRPKARVSAAQAAAAKAGEMKYFDSDNNGTLLVATTTTWPAGTMIDPLTTINLGAAAVATPQCLFAPTVGSALNQRIGRQVKVHKIKVHGHINIPAQAAQAAADSASKCRIVLVMDQQTNAGQMTGAQLFNDGSGAASTLNSFQNPNNFGRFRVLKDKIITIQNLNMAGSPSTADVIQAAARVNFKMTVNFKTPVIVHFNATNGGTVLDIVDNSFHIVAAADVIAYAPSLVYYARVCYKE